ncbi:MAG: dihydroxyacetone kinase subunit DhaK [Roseiflexus castenholzii]|uniref:dihydroxyacetone kinase subunit DhaK n=1 Tax=Roseiflexus castenholzii TaxID=120962 RepID=UPI000CA6F9F6|nr:MAG: dihydroxyacetone kinase subunit DhaK [Roseiflexus castenholzii]
MKMLINSADTIISDALEGFAQAYPGMARVMRNPDYVIRADAPLQNQVAIISGGGSGHEPMHIGYVGRGMLTAACPGAIFTSPTPDQILAATHAAAGDAGVLYIIKNYAGDRMNFEIAIETLLHEGVPTATVVVADDVANPAQDLRRSTGATIIVEKIAGAAAEMGASLTECAQVARRALRESRSIGVALSACTIPALNRPSFHLGDDEIEIGIGIHGEAGRQRTALAPVSQIVDLLCSALADDLDLHAGDRTLALVNGLGATTQIELYVAFGEVAQWCAARGIAIERRLVGNYMTSLDMAGCTITLMRLDDELLQLWDAPVCTPALRWGK